MVPRGAAALAFALACTPGGNAEQRPLLPALPLGSGVDNTLVFELPDSGGYLANATPVDRARIPDLVAEVFAPRRPELRAILVWDNPKRAWSDVAFLAEAAEAAGGAAYDAARSHWPRMSTVPSESLP